MKVDKQNIDEITTNVPLTPVDIGISDDPEDQKMILNVLTDSLYTDKPAAILREYGCNAADANVEAGKGNVPIKVHLPTAGEPFFSVRDNGFGMTEEQVLKTFCQLGRSTKRDSNEVTGMLGIGSKAGFAYGDSFLVSSFTKGKRVIYNCYRDERGLPTLAKMSESSTTEPDGVEVKVPVRAADIFHFAPTAAKVYKHFKVPPIGVPAPFRIVLSEGKGWRVTNSGESVAVMGNVGYIIPPAAVPALGLSGGGLDNLLAVGTEMEFPIGALDVAANREALQFRDKTKAAVICRLTDIKKEFSARYLAQVAKAASYWEAKCMVAAIQNDPRLGSLFRSILFAWRGNPIGNDLTVDLSTKNHPEVAVNKFSKPYYRTTLRQGFGWGGQNVEPSTDLAFIIIDETKHQKAKIKEFLTVKSNADSRRAVRAITFEFKSDAAKKAYLKAKGLEDAPMILISSLPKPEITPTSSRSYGVSPHQAKHAARAFTFDENKTSYSANSEMWTPTSIDKKGKGVYVEIANFDIVGPPQVSLLCFSKQLAALRNSGILKEPIYGIKKVGDMKLGIGWVPFSKWIADKFAILNLSKTFSQEVADYLASSHYDLPFRTNVSFPKDCLADQLVQKRKEMMADGKPYAPFLAEYTRGGMQPWLPSLVKGVAPSANLMDLERKVLTRYPLFAAYGKSNTRVIPAEAAVAYVTLIEETTK